MKKALILLLAVAALNAVTGGRIDALYSLVFGVVILALYVRFLHRTFVGGTAWRRRVMGLIELRYYHSGPWRQSMVLLDLRDPVRTFGRVRLLFPFPITIGAALLLIPSGPFVVMPPSDADEVWAALVWSLLAAPVVFGIAGLVLHFRPGVPRRWKYECVLLSLLAMAWVRLIVFTAYSGIVIYGWLEGIVLLMILAGGILGRLIKPETQRRGEFLPPTLLTQLRRVRMTTPLVLTLYAILLHISALRVLVSGFGMVVYALVWFVLIVYITARYLIIERCARAPILYLRSFAFRRSSEAFGFIVAPSVADYGVVVALVHDSNRASLLLERTGVSLFARMTTVADQHWQEWVLKSLRMCAAVVIERSLRTEGVQWELDTALRMKTDHSRIMLMDARWSGRLVKENTGSEDHRSIGAVQELTYDTADATTVEQARARLRRWLDTLVKMEETIAQ